MTNWQNNVLHLFFRLLPKIKGENRVNMRCFIIDTVATVVFFTIIAATTELFVAGMEPREVLITRLIMVPMMILTGRPYGVWRDWFFKVISPRNLFSRFIADSLAFMIFQLPIYILTLAIAGADVKEIISLIISSSALMLIISRPFGLYLEYIRGLAGIKRAPCN